MERGNLGRWLLIAAGIFLFLRFGTNFLGGEHKAPQPIGPADETVPVVATARAPETLCDLWGDKFHAQLSTRGASVKHYWLTSAKYRKDGKQFDISTTPDQELYQQLRFHFANQLEKAADRQVDPDLIDWALVKSDGKSCEFSYRDDKVELTKVVSVNARPYELNVTATVTNRSSAPLQHELTVNSDAWRYQHEV